MVETTKVAVFTIVVAFVGCSDPEPVADGATDATPDVAGLSDGTQSDLAPETSSEVLVPAAPAFLDQRGFSEVRLVAHLHSAYSHDGCDNTGIDADGKPNAACITRLRRALCRERIGHVFMTDHPSHMNEEPWEALFYPQPPSDDTVLRNPDGTPWAVRFACEAGEGGPDGRVTFMVGYEGTHTMPLGLRKQIDWDHNHAFEDATAPTDLLAVTNAVAAAGGKVAIAHSEETDLSAATIAQNDVAAMELYNFHATCNASGAGGTAA